jgi:hypothetical protein
LLPLRSIVIAICRLSFQCRLLPNTPGSPEESASRLIEFLDEQEIVTVADYFEPALREHLGSFVPEETRTFFFLGTVGDDRARRRDPPARRGRFIALSGTLGACRQAAAQRQVPLSLMPASISREGESASFLRAVPLLPVIVASSWLASHILHLSIVSQHFAASHPAFISGSSRAGQPPAESTSSSGLDLPGGRTERRAADPCGELMRAEPAPAGGHRDDFGADRLGKGDSIYDGALARGMNDVSELAAQRSSESGAASM